MRCGIAMEVARTQDEWDEFGRHFLEADHYGLDRDKLEIRSQKSERRGPKTSSIIFNGPHMDDDGQRPQDLKNRTRIFALRVVRFYVALPKKPESQVIGKQLLRAGTSVGAHYREGLRARSKSEYAAKLNAG